MTRREALAKATLLTSDVGAGLLQQEQARRFIRTLKDQGALASQMRLEIRSASTGEINKLSTGARLMRSATENADDGYRAGATFSTVEYTTKKVRLPWEVTEDVFHENIEGDSLESTLMDEMNAQFALDWEDLDINGDTADVSADAAFLTIDDGLIKLLEANVPSGQQVDGSTINSGVWAKEHMYAALQAIPNKYRRQGGLRWIMSPARHLQWWESIVDRAQYSGDDLLLGGGGVIDRPYGIEILEVPAWPDTIVALANPSNFMRVVNWQVRKRKVTGETDSALAARDKRFYIFFLKRDVIVSEYNSVALVDTLDAV
jgi:hypothetical protein